MSLFLLLCTVARIVFRIGWSLGVRVEGEPGGGGAWYEYVPRDTSFFTTCSFLCNRFMTQLLFSFMFCTQLARYLKCLGAFYVLLKVIREVGMS